MKTINSSARMEMVAEQLEGRGIQDRLVLNAMRQVPREKFVPADVREFAYEDSPLPIGSGQTISQPYIVACMIEALALVGGEKVLEIGAGSGYAAAVIAKIAKEVYAVERIESLASQAVETLRDLNYSNVHVLLGDGTRGCPQYSPFDAIVVSAGGPMVPDSLKSQLAVGGRMVIPVGKTGKSQELVKIRRMTETKFCSENIGVVRFVPLIGEEGWKVAKQVSPSDSN